MPSTSTFKLGRDLNQRDTIAVKHTVSGLLKLLYPNEEYDKEAVRRCLEYALETRRRVKEQLKKIGGMEFYDVHFSYIDIERLRREVHQRAGARWRITDPRWSAQSRRAAHGRHGQRRSPGPVPHRNPGHGWQRVAQDCRAWDPTRRPRKRSRSASTYFKANASHVSASIKGRRPRLPPPRRRTAQHRAERRR